MNAVILSAGQGRRLLPYTQQRPKCLLALHGRTLIEWQIDTLLAAGIETITVVVGFQAAAVETLVAARYPSQRVQTVFNPFYQAADNLGSCWIAREALAGDFILLNGDTLFETRVLTKLLAAERAPITLAVDHKDHYDADDMKVTLAGTRLKHIGKDLTACASHAESIGMLRFCGDGGAVFRALVESSLREVNAAQRWYLSVIDELAQNHPITVASIAGLDWQEVDYPEDYEQARRLVANWSQPSPTAVTSA